MKLRNLFEKISRLAAWVLCFPLPIQKSKVVVSNFYGRGYSDNPKAIVSELLSRNAGMRIIWLMGKDVKNDLPQGVEPCTIGTFRAVYHLTTAKVWIDNCRKGAWYKKKGQIYLQTWHGFALKRIEKDALHGLRPQDEAYGIRDSAQIDLLLSGSTTMSDIFRRCFWYEGEIALFGSPRNDALFHPVPDTEEKVRRTLGIPQRKRMILYAPTFRVDRSTDVYDVDFQRLRNACAKRFGGEWVVVLRLHPAMVAKAELMQSDGVTVFNATCYSDLQELLTVADGVVTDYSSLMFDYGLTGKPCFMYVPDLEAYRLDRNFYLDLLHLPFAQAENNDALERIIGNFEQESYRKKLAEFYRTHGFREDGQASRRTVDWLLNQVNQ